MLFRTHSDGNFAAPVRASLLGGGWFAVSADMSGLQLQSMCDETTHTKIQKASQRQLQHPFSKGKSTGSTVDVHTTMLPLQETWFLTFLVGGQAIKDHTAPAVP